MLRTQIIRSRASIRWWLSISVINRKGLHFLLLFLTASLTGCDSSSPQLGKVDSSNVVQSSVQSLDYESDIKPILDSRCIACHGCYDAPCQLKLTSYAGVDRGGSDTPVYDPERLREATTSRLHFDAQSTSQWREKGFHSVLRLPVDTGEKATHHSTLLGMLELKKSSALIQEQNNRLPINQPEEWHCSASADQFHEFASDYPSRGMPYGLPALQESQYQKIKT